MARVGLEEVEHHHHKDDRYGVKHVEVDLVLDDFPSTSLITR
jgi:hypothetical protein